MKMESQEQRELQIVQQLLRAREHIEFDVVATSDIPLKRIESNGVLVVTLSIVNELLPESVS
jgi:rRNA-processing protein FCF1